MAGPNLAGAERAQTTTCRAARSALKSGDLKTWSPRPDAPRRPARH